MYSAKKKLKVYVASKFENKEAVRAIMAKLKAAGHEITHDWTVEDATGMVEPELSVYMRKCAIKDRDAAASADVLLLLNHKGCKGAFSELGIALGVNSVYGNKYILLVDREAEPHNIFFYLDEVIDLPSADAALGFIEGIAHGVRTPTTTYRER